METVSENRCFGGVQGVYRHRSTACDCEMTFGLFLPQEAEHASVPVVWYLSGLTCTHENAMVKAGLQQWAAAEGIAVIFPDTSPRGEGVADDPAYDLGQGAGFYVNATEAPWAGHYQMWDYVADELPRIVTGSFAIDEARQSIMGHSMGGHGALTLAMSLPGRFASVSAFSPICNPVKTDWGRKQFAAYLGTDESRWAQHDATALMEAVGFDGPILIDTGTDDPFADHLRTEALAEAIARRRQQATVRLQKGYDHSYFFVSTFAEDHIAFHAEALFSVIYVDADACPVKAEAERVATRHGVKMFIVSNGGIRPSANPMVETVIVPDGPDIADMWIAERAGKGDIVVTGDIPLAAKCVAAGARVLKHNGEALTEANIGQVLGMRDLMADLRAADPFRQGGGKAFSKTDRSRFLDALEREVQRVKRGG